MEAKQGLLDRVSQPKPKEREGTSLETNNKVEEELDKHPVQSPREEKSHQESPQEPRKYPTSDVLEVEDALVNGLWEELKQRKLEAQKDKPPPLEEIDFDQQTLVLELRLELADEASEKTMESTKGILRTLPSFQGDYEAKLETKKVPS